MSITRS